jgi:hypothetical protein
MEDMETKRSELWGMAQINKKNKNKKINIQRTCKQTE